jgi:hypothetical protein
MVSLSNHKEGLTSFWRAQNEFFLMDPGLNPGTLRWLALITIFQRGS